MTLDKSLSSQQARRGTGQGEGEARKGTPGGGELLALEFKGQRGVVFSPCVSRSASQPGTEHSPYSRVSGAPCGWWVLALGQALAFRSSVSASHTKRRVLPASIKRDTVFNATVTGHEIPHRQRPGKTPVLSSTDFPVWAPSLWLFLAKELGLLLWGKESCYFLKIKVLAQKIVLS